LHDVTYYYLRQVGYVIVFVCLFVSTLHKNFQTGVYEILIEGWQWANEQMIKFWWRSRSWIRVRRALEEVCSVSVLLA